MNVCARLCCAYGSHGARLCCAYAARVCGAMPRGYASLTPAKFKRHSVALVDAPFGRVFCGRFTSLGRFNSGVTHFRPGMRLLYTANGLRHSHHSVSASDSRRKPQRFRTFWERMLSRSVSAITPLTRGSRNAHVKNSLTVSVI